MQLQWCNCCNHRTLAVHASTGLPLCALPCRSLLVCRLLEGMLQLAAALAEEQQQPLQEFAGLVGSMLLPSLQPPACADQPATPRGGGWGSEGNDGEGFSAGSSLDYNAEWNAYGRGDAHASDDAAAAVGRQATDGELRGRSQGRSSAGGQQQQQQQQRQQDAASPATGAAETTGSGRRGVLWQLGFGWSSSREAGFAAYHARHMRRVDGCAYLFLVTFFW